LSVTKGSLAEGECSDDELIEINSNDLTENGVRLADGWVLPSS